MKQTQLVKRVSLILCVVLIAALALFTGCSESQTVTSTDASVVKTTSTNVTSGATQVMVVGEGTNHFNFEVVDGAGTKTHFSVNTNQTTVGAALLECNLIEGEPGDYGLYVKKVNGITADYDKDGTYWAFYVNDTYATTGVDQTPIQTGETYQFKVEQ